MHTTHLHFLQALMRWNLSIQRKYLLLLGTQFLQKYGVSAIKVFGPSLGQENRWALTLRSTLSRLKGSIWISGGDKCTARARVISRWWWRWWRFYSSFNLRTASEIKYFQVSMSQLQLIKVQSFMLLQYLLLGGQKVSFCDVRIVFYDKKTAIRVLVSYHTRISSEASSISIHRLLIWK